MIDKIKSVSKSWFIDRVRFGERYLRYNLEDIVNKKSFENLPHVKTALNSERDSEGLIEKDKSAEKNSNDSQYDNLDVSEETPHDIDKLI